MNITRILEPDADAIVHDEVQLDHLQREKARLKVSSEAGETLQLFLERGKLLTPGTLLASDCGRILRVQARAEAVTTALAGDWLSFTKACYHLGNRHVRLQIGECWLRMTPDHVLEALLSSLGLDIRHEVAAFEPEPGAYQHGHHAH